MINHCKFNIIKTWVTIAHDHWPWKKWDKENVLTNFSELCLKTLEIKYLYKYF